KRNRKRLFHQLRISRTSERIVIILFVLTACGFQTKFVQFVPSLLIGIAADHCQNRTAEIWRERRWICEVFVETLAATGDNFGIIQISERPDQACAEPSIVRRLARFLLPSQSLKCWAQKRPGISLELFACCSAGQQTVNRYENLDHLFAFGEIRGSRQPFD